MTIEQQTQELYGLTPEELDASEEQMLRECGFSKEALAKQAKQGRFESETAKRTWFSLF